MTTNNQRRRRRRRTNWLAVLLVIAVLVAGGRAFWLWQCWGLETTYTQVNLAGLPEEFRGLRVVHLSDLHGHEYGENSQDLIQRVADEDPDLIFLTGDMIDQEKQLEMLPSLARGLAAVAPTYYVTGNHEWAQGTAVVKQMKALLELCGVRVLSNEYELLERNGDQMVLAGVDDPNGYADQKTPEELAEEIQEEYPERFVLLLAHRNDNFDQYAAAGYDLVLSGHAHGGIVRLPFTDGLISTGFRWFPTWTSGVYTLGDSTLFVSRGLGNNTVPVHGFRLFNQPEVCVLTLQSGSEAD